MPGRFYLLDVMRGFASLAVIIYHFPLFFVATHPTVAKVPREEQPFYPLLFPFYEHGFMAVQLFFVLSGFIFYWMYLDEVRERRVRGWRFFVLRFSRLYPLHFVTLLMVAGLQFAHQSTSGSFIFYHQNDLKHFLLNVAFVSHWGWQDDWSFNAPIWSVSVEVLLYAIFFVFARLGLQSFAACLLMMAAGAGLAHLATDQSIGYAVYCFYAGCLACRLYLSLRDRVFVVRRGPICILGCALVVVVGARLAQLVPGAYLPLVLFGLVFPALVLTLALIQEFSHESGRSIRLLGDLTYSTYLLHFPLALCFRVLDQHLFIQPAFASYGIFCGYFGLLFALSCLSYFWLERPAQRYFRMRLMPMQPKVP
ncbi:MAG: acyltransferase [Pseudomonadota bacterium]